MDAVSLIASATETIAALGHADTIVGISHECDHPPEAIAGRPRLTEPKLDVEQASARIDDQVKDLLEQALSIYEVDADALRDLDPDLIVTQDHCEVCAVSTADLDDALEAWLGEPPEVVSCHPDTLSDVFDDARAIAGALGDPAAGRDLVLEMKDRMGEIADEAKRLDATPTVAMIEWIDPLMVSGNWMPELVDLAGGQTAFGTKGDHSPYLDFPKLVGADPDAICVLPCGFDLERTRREVDALTGREGWDQLSAVRDGEVHLLDGLELFNRPGPRLVESVEVLAEICHPDVFDFGHRGEGWERL